MKQILVICTLFIVACNDGGQQSSTPAPQTLYSKLGGETAMKQIVSDFVETTINNPALMERFYHLRSNPGVKEHFSFMLKEQFSEIAGAPVRYSGLDMQTAHKGMEISDDEYNAMIQDLVATLNAYGVEKEDHQQFINLINNLRSDIVGR